MPLYHTAFLMLKESVTQAPFLHYPDPTKWYIVYTDTSDNACGAQLSQEHDGMEFPTAFLSHTFRDTQRKWSTFEQEAYGVYYAGTKWNYYLQGAEVIICNDHKLLARFLNGKNANYKVNRRGLELSTYNIIYEWILGSLKQSSWLSVQTGRAATWQANHSSDAHCHQSWWTHIQYQEQNCTVLHNRRSHSTKSMTDTVTQDITTSTPGVTPKPLNKDRLHTPLQMQRTNLFCMCISKHLSNRKAPKHEADLCLHIKGLLYKHVTNLVTRELLAHTAS